jgi:hypothetical protein
MLYPGVHHRHEVVYGYHDGLKHVAAREDADVECCHAENTAVKSSEPRAQGVHRVSHGQHNGITAIASQGPLAGIGLRLGMVPRIGSERASLAVGAVMTRRTQSSCHRAMRRILEGSHMVGPFALLVESRQGGQPSGFGPGCSSLTWEWVRASKIGASHGSGNQDYGCSGYGGSSGGHGETLRAIEVDATNDRYIHKRVLAGSQPRHRPASYARVAIGSTPAF